MKAPERAVILSGYGALVLLLLAACQAGPELPAAVTLMPTESLRTITPSPSVLPRSTLTPTQTPLIEWTATGTSEERSFCSPLQGYRLDQLASLVSNPFSPPAPGFDDPHQGIDLADRMEGSQVALSGREVTAILNGQVAAVIADRFPYGNAILVESPMGILPDGWREQLQAATPAPVLTPDQALTCPDVLEASWDTSRRSLYVLYAHLQAAPALRPGEAVSCDQPLGAIGDSGNALNPHLHLEVRLGPAGARFASLAHYDNSATLAEMDAYCTWRVRGIFQLVDPLKLLTALP